MLQLHVLAAALGLLGSVLYAGGKLGAALWGGPEISDRARNLAVLRFVLAVLAGPAFAATAAPIAVERFHSLNLPASALIIGLMINPVIEQATKAAFIRKLMADGLHALANRLEGAAQNDA
jgi:hypothetical protein